MIEARIVVDVDGQDVDEIIAAKCADFEITELEIGADGELLRHSLRPQLVNGLTADAAGPEAVGERTGPFVRIYFQPHEEAVDG